MHGADINSQNIALAIAAGTTSSFAVAAAIGFGTTAGKTRIIAVAACGSCSGLWLKRYGQVNRVIIFMFKI